jgi:uncharacterized membrane protein
VLKSFQKEEQMITYILIKIMHGIDLIGVGIICFGVLRAIIYYCLELLGQMPHITVDTVRLNLGRSIVLAVEFLLASDIIKTIITPDYYEIGMLGALVIIRTVLTYFLNQELSQLE